MKYISTRGQISPISFQDAVMMGLATDGGLILPESIPDVSKELATWRELSFQDTAFAVMKHYVTDMPDEDLKSLIEKSYATFEHDKVTPIVKSGKVHVMELFHGPTLAFKDVALQFLGNTFEYILKKRGGHLNILGATSGDTGSAAIHGLRGKQNINVFIMHPHNRTSPLQALQMTSVLDDNVHNIAIEGSFDDCQRIMKDTFGDIAFKDEFKLGAVNSVNWARVLAQVVYYFYAHAQVAKDSKQEINFCVPTGNFGDIFAGYIAKRMGLPIKHLILATNENNILTRFFTTGTYAQGDVFKTISPSMDIQVASNFERYLYFLLGEDSKQLSELMQQFKTTGSINHACDSKAGVDPLFLAGTGSTAQTLAVIKEHHDKENYLLDPHSAVGVHVAQSLVNDDTPTICLATAHPAKFPDAITNATGKDIARHDSLEVLKGSETQYDILAADQQLVMDYLRERV